MAFESLWDDGTLRRRGRDAIARGTWSDVGARYGDVIKSLESSGSYSKLGAITRTGDRAYGAYQVMGTNVPQWTREVLGKSMTPMEFLRDRGAQDAVFNAKFGDLVRKYGPEGASRAWFGGERGMNSARATDVHGRWTPVTYGQEFTRRLNASGTADLPLQKASVAAAPRPPASIPNTGLSQTMQSYATKLAQDIPGVQITSGARDLAHNTRVGGAKGSQHLTGNAIDVSLRGMTDGQKTAVLDHALANGAKGIGYYPSSDSMHIDFRQGAPAAWGPNYSQTSLGQTPQWFQQRATAHLKGQAPTTAVASTPPATSAAPASPTYPKAQGTPPAASGAAGGAGGSATAQTAPARAPGQTLGQQIIKGFGPRGSALTTFVDKATGIEYISGSMDGESYMFPVGRPSPAQAMESAVRKPAAQRPAYPSKPESAPPSQREYHGIHGSDPFSPDKVAPVFDPNDPFSGRYVDPNNVLDRPDVTSGLGNPSTTVEGGGGIPLNPFQPSPSAGALFPGEGAATSEFANVPWPTAQHPDIVLPTQLDPTFYDQSSTYLGNKAARAFEIGQQPAPGQGLPPKIPDRLQAGPPSVPPNPMRPEFSTRAMSPYDPLSVSPSSFKGTPAGAPLDLSRQFMPERVPSLGGQPATSTSVFDWVNQPRFDSGASVSDLRLSPFSQPTRADLAPTTSQFQTPIASQAMPLMQPTQSIPIGPQTLPWWMDPGWNSMGAFGAFGGGDFSGGAGFGGGGGLGGGLSFGGIGGW